MNPNSNFHMYQEMDDMLSLSHGVDSYSSTLIYNLSALRGKIHHLESFVSAIISSEQIQRQPDTLAISNAEAVLQEIISTASSTARALQQINLDFCPPNDIITSGLFTVDHQFNGNPSNNLSKPSNNGEHEASSSRTLNEDLHNQAIIIPTQLSMNTEAVSIKNNDCDPNIVELDAEALLARYTHYCQVCGKGFRRDANLRMHMRAHGDEYKTKSALTNPIKSSKLMKENGSSPKYSCPQEGCRWNKKHPRFTPLKSMVCVKNHYKRSHCAKMYVCKRCNQKQFSVLSDLITHEKHCGELRWRCSCGTFFSRKDKLMGHVALFVGHEPV